MLVHNIKQRINFRTSDGWRVCIMAIGVQVTSDMEEFIASQAKSFFDTRIEKGMTAQEVMAEFNDKYQTFQVALTLQQ